MIARAKMAHLDIQVAYQSSRDGVNQAAEERRRNDMKNHAADAISNGKGALDDDRREVLNLKTTKASRCVRVSFLLSRYPACPALPMAYPPLPPLKNFYSLFLLQKLYFRLNEGHWTFSAGSFSPYVTWCIPH